MGHSTPRFWAGRRVLVTAAGSPLGRELIAELLARGASVVALLGRTDSLGTMSRQVTAVRGRADDHARLTTTLVLHDVQVVFHLATFGLPAVRLAARMAGVLAVVAPPVASTNPVGDLLWRAEALAVPSVHAAAA